MCFAETVGNASDADEGWDPNAEQPPHDLGQRCVIGGCYARCVHYNDGKTLMQLDTNRDDLIERAAKFIRTRPQAGAVSTIEELEQRHTWRQIGKALDVLEAMGAKPSRYSSQLLTRLQDELPDHAEGEWHEPAPATPAPKPRAGARRYRCGICFDSGLVWADPEANDPNFVGYLFASEKVTCPACQPNDREASVSNERGLELARSTRAGLAAMFNNGGDL